MDYTSTNKLFTDIKRPCVYILLIYSSNICTMGINYHVNNGLCGDSLCRLMISVEKAKLANTSWTNIAKESNNLQPDSSRLWSLKESILYMCKC